MKNLFRQLGIITLVVIIWLFIGGCDSNASNETGNESKNTAGIFLNVGQIIDGAPLPFGSIRISRTGIGFSVTETISVNASDFDSGSIRWEITGVGYFSGETIIGSGSMFTLNATDVRYNSLGGHTLTLTVRKNGLQYQREIPFTIMQ